VCALRNYGFFFCTTVKEQAAGASQRLLGQAE
jgi:hypothetical protein